MALIRACLLRGQVRWTRHVTMRFRHRSLGREVLLNGADSLEIIEFYLDDKCLPSFLLRGDFESRTFHALVATDVEGDNVRVVTMYVPSLDEWDSDYRVRRVTE